MCLNRRTSRSYKVRPKGQSLSCPPGQPHSGCLTQIRPQLSSSSPPWPVCVPTPLVFPTCVHTHTDFPVSPNRVTVSAALVPSPVTQNLFVVSLSLSVSQNPPSPGGLYVPGSGAPPRGPFFSVCVTSDLRGVGLSSSTRPEESRRAKVPILRIPVPTGRGRRACNTEVPLLKCQARPFLPQDSLGPG